MLQVASLKEMSSVDLSFTRVNDELREYLLAADGLHEVWLDGTDVSEQVIHDVKLHRPDIKIYTSVD
jgi:hypothetical protein